MQLKGSCHCGVVHFSLNPKAPWVELGNRKGDETFDEFPRESLAEWHLRHGLEQ